MNELSYLNFLILILCSYSITVVITTCLNYAGLEKHNSVIIISSLFSTIMSCCLFFLLSGAFTLFVVMAITGSIIFIFNLIERPIENFNRIKAKDEIIQGLISFLEHSTTNYKKSEKKSEKEVSDNFNEKSFQSENTHIPPQKMGTKHSKALGEETDHKQDSNLFFEEDKISRSVYDEYIRGLLKEQELKFMNIIDDLMENQGQTKRKQLNEVTSYNYQKQVVPTVKKSVQNNELVSNIEGQGYSLSPFLSSQLKQNERPNRDNEK